MPEDRFLEDLKRRLPERPKLNGRDEYIRSAVMALMVKLDGVYHLALQKRHPDIRQGHEISFPGGRISSTLDRYATDTAVRETEEEMGIDSGCIEILGPLDFVIAPTGNLVQVVLGLAHVKSVEMFRPNPDEVTRLLFPPLTWFRDHRPETYHLQLRAFPEVERPDGSLEVLFPTRELGLPDRYHEVWDGARMPVIVYRYDGETIWGITARIIRDLVERAFGS